MPNFDADCLRELHDVQEVVIRTEKHRKNAVVIWVVVVDDEVFVRSWLGTRGRWYMDIAAGGPAALEFAGQLKIRHVFGQAWLKEHTDEPLLHDLIRDVETHIAALDQRGEPTRLVDSVRRKIRIEPT